MLSFTAVGRTCLFAQLVGAANLFIGCLRELGLTVNLVQNGYRDPHCNRARLWSLWISRLRLLS